MIKRAVSNAGLWKIPANNNRSASFGCDQRWYTQVWQRIAGCGPSVACNAMHWLRHIDTGTGFANKAAALAEMEEAWRFVTPSLKGVNTTRMFIDGMLAYAQSKGMDIRYQVLDLPKDQAARPSLQEILHFLDTALGEDAPVAFLNLNNGDVKDLDAWHWVTIISLEYEEDGSNAFVDIMDQGRIKKIDLALWYKTTTRGGGFVYFQRAL